MARVTYLFFKGNMMQFATITDDHIRVFQDGSFCLIIPNRQPWLLIVIIVKTSIPILLVKFNYCNIFLWLTLREKCPYSEFFWSVFSRFWTEYGEIPPISPYSVQMWGNKDQKNSGYGHFSPSVTLLFEHR